MNESLGQLTGQVIAGRYRLGEMLGQGGMGVVYAATQESLARPVALKVLQPMLAQSGQSLLRFRAEAERAGRLQHPHIVQILDFGHEPGGSAWIAMELLRGESLGQRIERGALSEAEVVSVTLETLSALEAAHAERLVHRDLKPDNIFLAEVQGIGTTVKVLDFGIAKLLDDENAGKLTATGMLIGTPFYMSPEQARGLDVDGRADLYSLGAVMYEALTGAPPFEAKNYNALLFSVLSETPPPIAARRADVTPALAAVVDRAMAKDPAQRFQSAREMAEALRAVAPSGHVPIVRQAGVSGELGTAATVATPAPSDPLGATTPVMGGIGGVTPASMTPGVAAAVGPATRATPAAMETARSASGPSQAKSVDKSGFRWWPIALAGGALAMATLAFVGANLMVSSREAEVAMAAPEGFSGDAVGGGAASAALEPIPPPPVAPVAPSLSGEAMEPSNDVGEAESDGADVDTGGVDTTHVDAEADERRGSRGARARRVPRYPPPRVFPSSFQFRGMSSSRDLREPLEAVGGWASCWPRTVPPPTVNMGRYFWVDIAADGRVVGIEPLPNNVEPAAFSSCVMEKIRAITFPAPATGSQVRVQIGFHTGAT